MSLLFKCVNAIAPSYLSDVLTPAPSINTRVRLLSYCICHIAMSIYLRNLLSTGPRCSRTPCLVSLESVDELTKLYKRMKF